ncbi:hypothetical protein B0H66DRAFT_217006 [Apodospora peruviana]|uniref:F-box domain-containing protein n=1 Tax=Apodospora peruviana TaxID=516989 RepID=A0AAE0IDE0_9PEZI|nr:hypothetical protein B0H66DRAFT_217006 [Apodospora peruviana]
MGHGIECTHRCKFVIPQRLLTAPVKLSSPIVTLPTELLLEIFAHADPVTTVCLALTCKRLLQVSSLTSIKIPSISHHRHRSRAAEATVTQIRYMPLMNCCAEMVSLLKPLERLHARERKIMRTALCHDCVRYVSTRPDSWHYPMEMLGPSGRQKEFHRVITTWSAGVTVQCPKCCFRPTCIY